MGSASPQGISSLIRGGIREGGQLTWIPTQSVSWGHASGHVFVLWILPTCLSARLATALHSCCTRAPNLGQAGAGRQGELPGQWLLTLALPRLLSHAGL